MGCGLLINAEDVKVKVEQDKPSPLYADGLNTDGTRWSAVSTQTVATLTTGNLSATNTIVIDDGTVEFWGGKGTKFTATISSSLFQKVLVSKEKSWLKASQFKNRKERTAPSQLPEDTARKLPDPRR